MKYAEKDMLNGENKPLSIDDNIIGPTVRAL